MKRKFLLFVAMLPIVTSVFAIKEEVGGIWYVISKDNKTAEVTSGDYWGYYSNSIEIPPSIVYEGDTCEVTAIGNKAFAFSNYITSVTVPNSVITIDEEAFCECSNLSSITIPNSVKSIGREAFKGCTSLTEISIPQKITKIDSCVFQYCSGLNDIIIPDSVKTIAANAFDGCKGVERITLPSEIARIEREAFAGLSQLKDVYCHAVKTPDAEPDIFLDSSIQYATLHVPVASKDQYMEKYPWGNFKSIVAIVDETQDVTLGEPCATPTISYMNGKLIFNCSTNDAICKSTITSADFNSFSSNEVTLTATYEISVYATKTGHKDSETVTAKLCWIDMEPKMEGIDNAIANVKACPVLIQNHGNKLSVSGVKDGTLISVYDTTGNRVGYGKSTKEQAQIETTLKNGEIGIVKIGDNTVKVLMK